MPITGTVRETQNAVAVSKGRGPLMQIRALPGIAALIEKIILNCLGKDFTCNILQLIYFVLRCLTFSLFQLQSFILHQNSTEEVDVQGK